MSCFVSVEDWNVVSLGLTFKVYLMMAHALSSLCALNPTVEMVA